MHKLLTVAALAATALLLVTGCGGTTATDQMTAAKAESMIEDGIPDELAKRDVTVDTVEATCVAADGDFDCFAVVTADGDPTEINIPVTVKCDAESCFWRSTL
jgi:hypothetical protein